MELIDPEYIEAAEKVPRKKKQPVMWPQWTALAACLAIMVLSGVVAVISPDTGTVINVSSEDTASLFSGGGAALITLAASALAALAIVAVIIKKKKNK